MAGPPPLLPSDHYLLQVLAESGVEVSTEDWQEFKAEVRRRAAAGPQPAVVAGAETLAIISLVSTLLSVGLTIVSILLKPRPGGRPASLEAVQRDPQNITNIRRYAPRYGFDAVQDPATLGTTIPVVYALRETRGSVTVGGIRVNLPLLWSQIESQGGNQLLRAIFLLSEATIGELDVRNFAIGNNAISSYDLSSEAANQLGSRMTVYFRPAGGRIRSSDRVLGRAAGNDIGNAENLGGPDVFAIRRGGAWQTDFSSASRPSTQTTFGLYTLIGNNLGFRVNPSIRPTVVANLVPKGDKGDGKVKCRKDDAAQAARNKYRAIFSSRSGLIAGSVSSVGSTITYHLDPSTDVLTEFETDAATAGSNWSASILVQPDNGNPFPAQSSISNTQLEALVSLSSLVTDFIATVLRLSVAFNVPAASLLIQNVPDGTYIIIYNVILTEKDQDGNIKREIEENYTITAYKSTTYTANFTPGGTYIPPTLNGDLTAGYTLAPGSLTPGGSVTLAPVKNFTYNPISKTFVVNIKTKNKTIEKAGDVGSAVAGRQKAWDDALVVGDLYKVGSALAICTDRQPADGLFESDADFVPVVAGAGRPIDVTFTTVRPGNVTLTTLEVLQAPGNSDTPPPRATATSGPHVYRVALANVTTSRPCRIVEIGIRSTMGIRLTGLCNFRDSLTYDQINGKACEDYEDDTIKKGDTLKVDIFQSGVISTSELRYAFFRLSYREAGSSASFVEMPQVFGVSCITQQAAFNSLRLNMGSVNRWEFRFEPLSGWEIRSGTAGGSLEVIDNKLETDRFVSAGPVTVRFRGTTVPRTKEQFAINTVRRAADDEIGIGFTDEDSYLDAWGKLAESFVYEEVQSSASSGPEHEIVYINEIVENVTIPRYDDISIVGLNIRSSLEFQQFSQFSAYVTKGIQCRRLLAGLSVGPTHLFPDVLLDLMTNKRYGRGDIIPDELIDLDSFRAAAQWCQDRGYFFDGALTSRTNLRTWAADTAATNLLIFGEANGRFFLKPAFPMGPVQLQGLFTAGNIREESFAYQTLEAEERRPIQVSVRWREERASSNPTNPGLFPVEREILVREAATPDTATIESIDMSDYCTSRTHAIDAAKYVILARRLGVAVIRYDTTHEGILSALAPGDFIKVALDTTVYDQFRNGVITPAGNLVCTTPLADGSYSVIAWNGDNAVAPADTTITVTGGGATASPAGLVFTVKTPASEVRTFQVESIEPNPEGYITIEAINAPMRANNQLEIAALLDQASNWIIQE